MFQNNDESATFYMTKYKKDLKSMLQKYSVYFDIVLFDTKEIFY